MEIRLADMKSKDVLQLFSEHDDFMLDFLGDDRAIYTRYSERENIERVWIAYREEVPAGCIAYRLKSDSVGEVKRMFIREKYRGRGMSGDLLKTVEQYAREQGCHTLFLDTRITLEPAVSVYRRFGFEIIFQQGLYIQMEKKL